MQKVNSFIIDHKKLLPGVYECQVNGVFTYDIRFVKPQDAAHRGLFMDPKVAHTLEHFMADYLRTKTSEEFSSTLLYVGPMGCLTGFYFLTSISYTAEFWRKMVLECVNYILTQDVDLDTLTLQESEVQAVKWADEEEILAIMADGQFLPYHQSLIQLFFALKDSRGAHVSKLGKNIR